MPWLITSEVVVSMWNEQDDMMKLLASVDNREGVFPAICPQCGRSDAHILFHRFADGDDRGSAWVWCSACKSYEHFSYRIPEWWCNPPFIDENSLDSVVDYPESMKCEIDEWVSSQFGR